jgi:5-methylcytosine-specific restriction endonuclease McrA
VAVHTVPSSSSSPQLDSHEIAREVEKIALECRRHLFPERQRITELRLQLFERSAGRCELRLSPRCLDWISWATMRTHIVSASRGEAFQLSNLKASCPECHIGSKARTV